MNKSIKIGTILWMIPSEVGEKRKTGVFGVVVAINDVELSIQWSDFKKPLDHSIVAMNIWINKEKNTFVIA